MRKYLLLLLLALPCCCPSAQQPTTLRIVDLRWLRTQPELTTWLGCLQGVINRRHGDTAIFLITNNTEAGWADTLVRSYHLKREQFSAEALLAAEKDQLTGQVLYDPAEPWTRNIALTIAAVQPGAVIAAATDWGVPTVLDLHKRWTNRRDAYGWMIEQYADKADNHGLVLAPESGQMLADFITARRYLALDLSPQLPGELEMLTALLKRYPEGTTVFGAPDDRTQVNPAIAQLDTALGAFQDELAPVRVTGNLSCFACFPVIRPMLQSRRELDMPEGKSILVLLYGSHNSIPGGSRSLDYACGPLRELLDDPAFAALPVGIEVPAALWDVAPVVYQTLLARQRFTSAEFIAAPMLRKLDEYRRAMNLTAMSLCRMEDTQHIAQAVADLAKTKWLGAFLPKAGQSVSQMNFLAWPTSEPITSITALRAALRDTKAPFRVLYLDPVAIPPDMLARMLPEITPHYSLQAPSQALRGVEEAALVLPYLGAQGEKAKRAAAKLQVSVPAATLVAPTAAEAIPVSVHIEGATPVLAARLIYNATSGEVDTVDLQPAHDGLWQASLPPMLSGGECTVRARVVEQEGYGVSMTDPLTLTIPHVDSDRDGLEDTLEEYLGTDPHNPNSLSDGLPDGLHSFPVRFSRDVPQLMPTIFPPVDRAVLSRAGTSTGDEQGRLIPAHSSVSYRIPLQDIPAAQAWLQVGSSGAGSITLNGGAAHALETLPAEGALTALPLAGAQPPGAELAVTITAGDKPMHLLSLDITGNPDGPYLLPAQLSPAYPFAGVPIPVQVIVYAPAGVKSVTLYYYSQPGAAHMHTLALQPVDGAFHAQFAGNIPAQEQGTRLLYRVEAVDRKGNVSTGAYAAVPIGRAAGHSVALFGTRELQAAALLHERDAQGHDLEDGWYPIPVWGGCGRVSTVDCGTDVGTFLTRPGTYHAWLLAAPRERGVNVTVQIRVPDGEHNPLLLTRRVPPGAKDGWYNLGTFSTEKSTRVKVLVSPEGAQGYCAYGEVVLTQDNDFIPPLAHGAIDWFNNVLITGVSNGDSITGPLRITVRACGNIDKVVVAAQKAGAILDRDTHPFVRQEDGSYLLDTRMLAPGDYHILVQGLRVVKERNGKTSSDSIYQDEVDVTIRQ